MRKNWMWTLIIATTFVGVTSCGEKEDAKDEQFCKCLEAGEAFSTMSSKFMTTRPSAEEEAKLKKLKAKEKEACKNYQRMGGDEMLKRKAACEGKKAQ